MDDQLLPFLSPVCHKSRRIPHSYQGIAIPSELYITVGLFLFAMSGATNYFKKTKKNCLLTVLSFSVIDHVEYAVKVVKELSRSLSSSNGIFESRCALKFFYQAFPFYNNYNYDTFSFKTYA